VAEHQPSIAFAVQRSDAAVTTAFLSSTGRISRCRDQFANAQAGDDEFAANDITRASLDGESFYPAVQQAVNRVQSREETAATTERRRAAGVGCVSFDLTYGRPHQTATSCADTVSTCLQLRPDRFYGVWLR